MKQSKNKQLVKEFVKYCEKHPELRFWQALRNWSGFPYLLIAKSSDFEDNGYGGIEDTFYWEEKDN